MLIIYIMYGECIMLTGKSRSDAPRISAIVVPLSADLGIADLVAYLTAERRVAIHTGEDTRKAVKSFFPTSKGVHPDFWILKSFTSWNAVYTYHPRHPGKILLLYPFSLGLWDFDRDVLYGMHARQGLRQPKPIFILHIALSLSSNIQSATVIAF